MSMERWWNDPDGKPEVLELAYRRSHGERPATNHLNHGIAITFQFWLKLDDKSGNITSRSVCCIKSSGLLSGVVFWYMTNVSGSLVFPVFLKTLKMGQTSDPETLVIYQKTTPGNNPEDFMQHYDHGGSLQSQDLYAFVSPSWEQLAEFLSEWEIFAAKVVTCPVYYICILWFVSRLNKDLVVLGYGVVPLDKWLLVFVGT